jgi:elongation factor Ts
MAEISASLVKELREKTGAGMMDCKKALAENQGEIEAAIDWLRAKGLSKAAKKADRAAAEGLVAAAGERLGAGAKAALVEFNAETDFVARNDTFQAAARGFARAALKVEGDLAKLLTEPNPSGEGNVQDAVTALIATIGENMMLRRAASLSANPGAVGVYVHNAVADGLGRLGVLVALESSGAPAALEDLARKIAMHVAATNPVALSEAEVPADRLEREKAILAEQIAQDPKAAGKPQQVLDKMMEGRLRKFLEEVVLLKQAFVMNPDLTVEAAVKAAEKDVGASIRVKGFVRFALGEGVDKGQGSDFAAEVAAMTAGQA